MGNPHVLLQPAKGKTDEWLVSVDVDSHPLVWTETLVEAVCQARRITTAVVAEEAGWLLQVTSRVDPDELGAVIGGIVCRHKRWSGRNVVVREITST